MTTIGMSIPAQDALVDAYGQTADSLRNNRIGGISPLLQEAAALLSTPTKQISDQMRQVEANLRQDAIDIQWRGDFLVEADRALAHKLELRAGALISPHLAETATRNGWTYREAELRAELAALRTAPPHEQTRHATRILEITGHLQALEHSTNPATPDPGGTLSTERRAKFISATGTSASAGMNVIVEALNHTADPSRVANDEFEIVHLDNGKIIIILPGVADLTETVTSTGRLAIAASVLPKQAEALVHVKGAIGWNGHHHSARDTWIAARKSAGSAKVADNRYAQLVRNFVNSAVASGEMQEGADVMIIGHSYGADTAVDLAADPSFNGELVNVTHVVAAAYHSEPQLEFVPVTTEVAVVQNIKDLVILGEAKLDSDRDSTGAQLHSTVGSVAVNAGIDVVNLATESAFEVAEVAAEVATNTVKEVTHSTSTERHSSVTYADFEFDAPDIKKVDKLELVTKAENIVLAEFDGGFEGIGHHQNNYNEYLESTTHPALISFFKDVASSGYNGNGLTWAVDVSVPEEMR